MTATTYVPTTNVSKHFADDTINQLTSGFIANTSKETLEAILANLEDIVDMAKYQVSQPDLVDEDFDFIAGLETEGYYLLPDGEFDYGNTQSSGTRLVDVDPRVDKQDFKDYLGVTIQAIIDYLYK